MYVHYISDVSILHWLNSTSETAQVDNVTVVVKWNSNQITQIAMSYLSQSHFLLELVNRQPSLPAKGAINSQSLTTPHTQLVLLVETVQETVIS